MITLFNRRELLITRDISVLNRLRDKLDALNIRHIVRTNSLINPGRNRGIPGIDPDCACEYRVYIRKKDYENFSTAK